MKFKEIEEYFRKDLLAAYNIKAEDDLTGLIGKIVNNSELLLRTSLITLARNHNFFGEIDHYMKGFSKEILKLSEPMTQRLEQALTSEIVIRSARQENMINANNFLESLSHPSLYEDAATSHLPVAKADFQYLPVGLKQNALDEFRAFVETIHRTKEGLFAIEHLRDSQDPAVQTAIYSKIQEFEQFVVQLDLGNKSGLLQDAELASTPLVNMAMNSLNAIRQYSAKVIYDRYAVSGVNITNLEELYNPMFTGIFDMLDNRQNLIKHGMTAQFADQLAKRYIDKFTPHEVLGENGHICSIMDLFNTKASGSKALTQLLKADF